MNLKNEEDDYEDDTISIADPLNEVISFFTPKFTYMLNILKCYIMLTLALDLAD